MKKTTIIMFAVFVIGWFFVFWFLWKDVSENTQILPTPSFWVYSVSAEEEEPEEPEYTPIPWTCFSLIENADPTEIVWCQGYNACQAWGQPHYSYPGPVAKNERICLNRRQLSRPFEEIDVDDVTVSCPTWYIGGPTLYLPYFEDCDPSLKTDGTSPRWSIDVIRIN